MAHDLSFNKVELDIHELIKVAGQACSNARSQMNKNQSIVDENVLKSHSGGQDEESIYHHNHIAQFYANAMAKSAQEYANAMNTYFVLVECLHREEIVINKEQI